MNYQYGFEKFEIWRLAIDLSVEIYKFTDTFPEKEKFGLISQIRRASNSISANIAEGMSRTGNDRLRFIRIAYGSTIEVLSHLILSERLFFITFDQLSIFRMSVGELTNKINAFANKIKNE